MGIDIYARWRNMPKEDQEAQMTGFSAVAGDVGYLREAYHGDPYVTKYLLKEAFEAKECEAKICGQKEQEIGEPVLIEASY